MFIVDVFKDRTQSSWVKECAPTKHPITEIWVKEFNIILKTYAIKLGYAGYLSYLHVLVRKPTINLK